MSIKPLIIPGLYAQYKNWPYYQVTLKVEDLVKNLGSVDAPNYRVHTTNEVEVIYSQKGINNLLQRVLDESRLEPIRKFIIEQPDAYVNNLTVAIYGGDPQWYPVNITRSTLNVDIGEDNYTDLNNSFGVIKLSGEETLFVLDGQHRLKALRLAYEQDRSIGSNQISLTLITHIDSDEGKKKTRRLFSIINRYAKPVSLGESILLDEDDLSAIIVRKFIEEYPLLKEKEVVALNKTTDLKLPKDQDKFTSVILLWSVNEKLINSKEVYPKFSGTKLNLVRVRPEDVVIENYKNIVFKYWDLFFICFPKAKSFIENPAHNLRGVGGPISLRPIGQQIFCDFYLKMVDLNRIEDLTIIKIIPDNLNDPFWHFVLFDPIGQAMMLRTSYARDYLFYHLNIPLTTKQMSSLLKNYKKYNRDENISLPKRLIDN